MRHALLCLCLGAMLLPQVGCNDEQRVEVGNGDPRSREISRHVIDLQANNPSVRRRAAEQLGQMQATEPQAIEALADGLRDPDQGVRMSSAQSLGRIGSQNALEELRDASHEGYQEARQVYTNQTSALRQQAQQGDPSARNMLDRLGEEGVR